MTNYANIAGSVPEGVIKRKIKTKKGVYWKNRYLFLMFLPGFIYFLIFRYGPLYGLLMAFKDYSLTDGVWASPWAGLKHFKMLVNGQYFTHVLYNTVYISLAKILIGFPAPIILALMLHNVRNAAYRRIAQTISYLPHFFSWVVLGGLITLILSPNTGIVNQIIKAAGHEPIFFIASNKWFVPIAIITDIWKEIGWGSIIYLAALSGVNPELYEAAEIDGAGKMRQIISITLPTIVPTIVTMLILRIGSILDAGFDQIFNLYSPAVYETADIIDTYIYRMGLGSFQYSFATAAGVFKSIIGLMMVLLTNTITKKISGEGII